MMTNYIYISPIATAHLSSSLSPPPTHLGELFHNLLHGQILQWREELDEVGYEAHDIHVHCYHGPDMRVNQLDGHVLLRAILLRQSAAVHLRTGGDEMGTHTYRQTDRQTDRHQVDRRQAYLRYTTWAYGGSIHLNAFSVIVAEGFAQRIVSHVPRVCLCATQREDEGTSPITNHSTDRYSIRWDGTAIVGHTTTAMSTCSHHGAVLQLLQVSTKVFTMNSWIYISRRGRGDQCKGLTGRGQGGRRPTGQVWWR